MSVYLWSMIGLWVIVATIILQVLVATVAHRRQKRVVPGVVDSSLGHESFVFRSDRTFKNSLENALPFAALALIATISGFPAFNLSVAIWVFAVARLAHTALYYAIATEKNPSPRSYFYMIGLFATLYLAAHLGVHLFSLA